MMIVSSKSMFTVIDFIDFAFVFVSGIVSVESFTAQK